MDELAVKENLLELLGKSGLKYMVQQEALQKKSMIQKVKKIVLKMMPLQ